MNDEEKPAAMLAHTGTSRTLVDGTLRIILDFEPLHAPQAFNLFGTIGTWVAIAKVESAVAEREMVLESAKVNNAGSITMVEPDAAKYGSYAKELKLSGFFRAPEVWKHIGTDKDLQIWVRQQKCVVKSYCHGDVVPAHVRRIADGAGTGIKPEYAVVPLCDKHHKLQHQEGESAVMSKEEFDRLRVKINSDWGWETLKDRLGYAHWSEVPPGILYNWAYERDLDRYLPACYKPE